MTILEELRRCHRSRGFLLHVLLRTVLDLVLQTVWSRIGSAGNLSTVSPSWQSGTVATGRAERTRRAVGPHALGFFFADTASNGSGEIEVVTATRLFFDNDDNADTSNLIAVLDMLIERASEYSPGTFEPRTHMCNRVETMLATAELVGIGITTVSAPPTASVGYITLGMDRPYKAVARMVDGTDLLIRCDGGFLASADVRSTQTLNVGGMRTRHWEWLPTQLLRTTETRAAADPPPAECTTGLRGG